MENKFGKLMRSLHGKRVKDTVAELISKMSIGFYADLQLQRARCRGDIKTSLVPGCDGEDLVPSHEPNPRTKVLHHGNNVSLLGKSKQVGLLSLVELESIHSWALSEDRYEL